MIRFFPIDEGSQTPGVDFSGCNLGRAALWAVLCSGLLSGCAFRHTAKRDNAKWTVLVVCHGGADTFCEKTEGRLVSVLQEAGANAIGLRQTGLSIAPEPAAAYADELKALGISSVVDITFPPDFSGVGETQIAMTIKSLKEPRPNKNDGLQALATALGNIPLMFIK
jgi:hypothetical protein